MWAVSLLRAIYSSVISRYTVNWMHRNVTQRTFQRINVRMEETMGNGKKITYSLATAIAFMCSDQKKKPVALAKKKLNFKQQWPRKWIGIHWIFRFRNTFALHCFHFRRWLTQFFLALLLLLFFYRSIYFIIWRSHNFHCGHRFFFLLFLNILLNWISWKVIAVHFSITHIAWIFSHISV